MVTQITEGIKISVETYFQQAQSSPEQQYYVYSYRVRIQNESSLSIQLLRRQWHICDAFGVKREVKGEGVVGEQPIIPAGKSYEYISGCDFCTEIGKMYGTYLVERLIDGEFFEVQIPEFSMVYPFKLN